MNVTFPLGPFRVFEITTESDETPHTEILLKTTNLRVAMDRKQAGESKAEAQHNDFIWYEVIDAAGVEITWPIYERLKDIGSIRTALVPGNSSCHSKEVELSVYAFHTDASSIAVQIEGAHEWATAHLTPSQAEYMAYMLLYLAKVSDRPPTMRNPFQSAKEGEQA